MPRLPYAEVLSNFSILEIYFAENTVSSKNLSLIHNYGSPQAYFSPSNQLLQIDVSFDVSRDWRTFQYRYNSKKDEMVITLWDTKNCVNLMTLWDAGNCVMYVSTDDPDIVLLSSEINEYDNFVICGLVIKNASSRVPIELKPDQDVQIYIFEDM